jgi:prolipoprotein diacylglyceryltransferase
MIPFIHVGLFTLQSRGVIIIIAFWIASTIFERTAQKSGINREEVNSLSFTALVVLIVAARIGYIVQYLPIYFSTPQAALALDLNTLDVIRNND